MNNKFRILIAGVGNELRGDDGLGPAVINELAKRSWPSNVDLINFGERLYDLLLKLEDYDIVIVVDALDMSGEPGEIYIIEPGDKFSKLSNLNPHTVNLREIINLSKHLKMIPKKIYVIGCQPKDISKRLGLSNIVSNRVSKITSIIEKIIKNYI